MGAAARMVIGAVPISAADVFTASATLGAAVSVIQVTNTGASNINLTVTVSLDGSTYIKLASLIVVPPATAVGILTGTLNMAYGGRIRMLGSASGLEYVVSCLDYS